jgi:hypothetical protein
MKAINRATRITAVAVLALAATGCAGDSGVPDPAGAGPEASSPPPARPAPLTWQARAAAIDGIVNFRRERPEILTQEHLAGPLEYEVLPPVGGDHNDVWMNCEGVAYPEQVPNEHAVHSLEHGAAWVTYRPDLPEDQVEALAQRVRGTAYLFMSPFPGLDAPISLQAWAYQLKVDDATDPRIDEFIQVLAGNAGPESPGAPCDGGTMTTGTVPDS